MLRNRFFAILAGIVVTICIAGSASAVQFVNIATASTKGTYYPVGVAMAKIWNDGITDLKAGVQTSGGTVHNIQLMEAHEADVAFMDGVSYTAFTGTGKYEGNPKKFIRAMVPLFPEVVQLIVAKNSGIKNFSDFKGKRVSIGAVASGTEVMAKHLLLAAGIDPDKDITPERLSIADTAKAFADKRIDAAVFVGSLGVPGVVEMTTLDLVRFLDIPSDLRDKVLSDIPAWKAFSIPAGTYSNQDKPVQGYASWNMLTVRDDVSDDLVYSMTKLLYEKKSDLVMVASKMKLMDPANLNQIVLPLHPGAERYYREIGALK